MSIKCSFCGIDQSECRWIFSSPTSNGKHYICDKCIGKISSQIEELKLEYPEEKAFLTPSVIKSKLDSYVIGQDRAKKILSVAVYNHYKRLRKRNAGVEIQKSNILLIGSTGCGKTYLAQTLARILDVPFVICDATGLTQAGYVGKDVEECLSSLLKKADGSIEKAQTGIVYIDEIDKLARVGDSSAQRDVSGEGVQQALLKLLEGHVISIPVGDKKSPFTSTVDIDTSNILFICGGAFDGIQKKIEPEKTIGFGHAIPKINEFSYNEIESSDLVKYGLTPELTGRLPVIASLDGLDENALVRILVEPKNSIVSQYKELLKMDNVSLVFEQDALVEIARTALRKKTGARGLRSIMESTMTDIMFEAPDIVCEDTYEIRIAKDMVKGGGRIG